MKKVILLEENKNLLFENHKNVIMLIEENKIDQYTSLQNKLAEYNEELGSNKNIKSTYNHLESYVEKLIIELEETEIEDSSDNRVDSLSIFNQYFSKYSEKQTENLLCFINQRMAFRLVLIKSKED